MPTNCTQTPDGCIDCPYIPPTPPTPGHLDISGIAAWNAGADSVLTLDGDLHVVCSPPLGVVAEFCGFRSSRDNNFVPQLIDYGFCFQNTGGVDLVSMVERGSVVHGGVARADSWHFEIIRIERYVRYNIFDDTDALVVTYLSARPSFGPVLLNGCIFLSGDVVE